jgi:23S rRNA (adenine2503-C2)-methyltransferase
MKPHYKNISLTGLTLSQLEYLLYGYEIESKYAARLLYWVYRRKITSFDIIDDIPKKVLARISEIFTPGITPPFSSMASEDGSIKYIFRSDKGLYYESVFIPDVKRSTLCISVQSGCRMGCRFCATGKYGWHGNLTAGEIINQVTCLPFEITHIVFMGMGEPCDNVDEVINACTILTSEWGLAKGRANITVSTVGLMPGLKQLLNCTECNITLSLHSPFPAERAEMVPAEKKWPSSEAIKMLHDFKSLHKRRFSVAYVMIDGINDTDRHLEELNRLLTGTGIRVNLLPYHSLPADKYHSTPFQRMMLFKHLLVTSGTGASLRRSRGTDVYAACGMLAAVTSQETEFSQII